MLLRMSSDSNNVFVLHAHSTMSMLDGASSVQDYVDFAKKNSHPICSCTDHGWLSGVYDLLTYSEKQGIRPIPGCEFYLCPHENHRTANFSEDDYFHLTVWAINQRGYSNLVKLASISWMDDRPSLRWGKYKPRIRWSDLFEFKEGLVIGSGCIEGPIGKCLLKGEIEQARLNAQILRSEFGDKMLFELMPSKVDRDYVRGECVAVQGVNGITYRFLPDDILVTDMGCIPASEAVIRKPRVITSVKPVRAQDTRHSSDAIKIDLPNVDSIESDWSSPSLPDSI